MMTQEQMYWKAHDRIAGQNEMFLLLVDEGMTREELETNIQKRPALWGRFSGWLGKLPTKVQVAEQQCRVALAEERQQTHEWLMG